MRCPICGGPMVMMSDPLKFRCGCAGPVIEVQWARFSPVYHRGSPDREIERYRRRRVEEGYGWSWFDMWRRPYDGFEDL